MATIRIEFSTDNAAFEGDPMPEIHAVLARAIKAMEREQRGDTFATVNTRLRDSNGNTIGSVKVEV